MAQRAGVIIYSISTSTQWVNVDDERDPAKRVNRKYEKGEGDHVLDQLAEKQADAPFFPTGSTIWDNRSSTSGMNCATSMRLLTVPETASPTEGFTRFAFR